MGMDDDCPLCNSGSEIVYRINRNEKDLCDLRGDHESDYKTILEHIQKTTDDFMEQNKTTNARIDKLIQGAIMMLVGGLSLLATQLLSLIFG